jgi:hypothetical protein
VVHVVVVVLLLELLPLGGARMKTATADGNVRQWLPKPCTLTAGAAAALLLSVIALSKPLFFSFGFDRW